jgi:CelD/BcsL family acetyltransferase involved in cellulose biosynthesis
MPFHKTFDQLLRFHEARWSNRSNTGALMRRADAFHREAAQAMLHHGTLRLYGLNIGGQIVAVLYGFRHRRRGYFYLMGFDAAFSKISPGVLLMIYAIEELIREEAISCEFLRGHEPFKYRWGVSERNTYGLRIHHRT